MTTTDGSDPNRSPRRRPRTRQRQAVDQALSRNQEFVSAQQLHSQLRADGERIGLATVYRTLQTMTEDGDVDIVRSADGEALYRQCSSGHHHHLTCRICRRTVEVDSAAIERWAREVAGANDFADITHVVEVFGTCATCSGAARGLG